MLEARSVAVIGASPRAGSFGLELMRQLAGFDGAVHPVNPKHREVNGQPSFPSIGDVPGPVDTALLAVPNARLQEQLAAAIEAGARSAVIYASCHESPPREPSLIERLGHMARAAGIAVCGGNGMGFVDVERGLRACGFREPAGIAPGPIGFVTHSGSVFSALLHNDRGLRFNLAVSAGNELATTLADYLRYLLERSSTKVVALFLETVRDPEGFREGLAAAAERDVPVVVLKVGSAAAARPLVTAHSGALAGEDAAYQAVFDAYGAIRVQTLDEMADTLELLSAGRRAAPGGLAAIHDSGGERAHLIDAAEAGGVRLAEIGEATRRRLEATLEPGLPAVNPLDAWGTGNDFEEIFAQGALALLDDPDTAALAFAVDMTTEEEPETGYVRVAREIYKRTAKPVALLSNLASAIDRRDAAFAREGGLPILESTATGLAALRHLMELRDHRARPPVAAPKPVRPPVRERWAARLAAGTRLGEPEGLELLRDYGIPTVAALPAANAARAIEAAERTGWPVALKTAAGVAHKSDAGGVCLDLRTPDELRAAYERIADRLGSKVLVEPMAGPGIELALGIVYDEQFGPLVMAAAGGVWVEALADRRFALPPLDAASALRLLGRLRIWRVLSGRRTYDADAAAAALVRLSALATDLGDRLAALDVNPLIVTERGCAAADALVVPR